MNFEKDKWYTFVICKDCSFIMYENLAKATYKEIILTDLEREEDEKVST